MKYPIISVIIPAHNEERYISRCVRSIVSQSLATSDFEVIVVDDSSTDRTVAAVTHSSNNLVKLIKHNKNLGLAASLNTGIKSAQGRFIVRLDADDYVSYDYLYALYLFLSHNPTMDAVACDYFLVDDNENTIERRNCIEHPIGCGIMFRMEQLLEIGLYDESFRLHEDQDLRIRFEKKFKIERIALPLYRYRRHSENLTNDLSAMETHLKKLKDKHQ